MAKMVNTGRDRITLADHDISHYVTRWAVASEVGDIVSVELDVVHVRGASNNPLRFGGREDRSRAVITVYGTDIASWMSGYDVISRPGTEDVVRLYLYADKDNVTINGQTPWELTHAAQEA